MSLTTAFRPQPDTSGRVQIDPAVRNVFVTLGVIALLFGGWQLIKPGPGIEIVTDKSSYEVDEQIWVSTTHERGGLVELVIVGCDYPYTQVSLPDSGRRGERMLCTPTPAAMNGTTFTIRVESPSGKTYDTHTVTVAAAQ